MKSWHDDYSSDEEDDFGLRYDSSEYIDWNEDSSSAISEDRYKFRKENSKQLKLENIYLEDIAKAIAGDHNDEKESFLAEDEFRSSDIGIKVEGIGRLSFPLNENSIQKLIAISSKACFGKGEDTIVDENVRDTHEIPGEKLKVTIDQNSLSKSLENVRSAMKLASNCVFKTELHNMLIYGPGQFFDFHQDSEKMENMVGSLVVIIPSPHIGGDLVIQHGKKEHHFISEHIAAKGFKCIYFYADCLHKIEKVRQGYRVALTYKLISQPLEDPFSQPVNQNLKIAVHDYFSHWKNECPAKLVFFLDHSYTEHSLRWHLLKGQDQVNGNAFLMVAKELRLIPYLVLVNIHHVWHDSHDHQVARIINVHLLEDEYELSHFIDSNNKGHPLPFEKCSVTHPEICWTKETNESFKPDGTYVEGYTGNTGINLEYWYKRAGVVLWPSESEIQMKFLENKEKNLDELKVKIACPGNEDEVKETVRICGKYFCPKFYEESAFDFLSEIAVYIKNEDLALPLLSVFKWTILNNDIAKSLYKLESQYGVDWCNKLFSKWQVNPENFGYSFNGKILEKIDVFVENYLRCGGSTRIVELILEEQIDKVFHKEDKTSTCGWSRSKEDLLKRRMENAHKFFALCASSQNSKVIEKAVNVIKSLSLLYPVDNLLGLYLKLKQEIIPSNLNACEPLKTYLHKTISAAISKKKAKNDWSINGSLNCDCKVCLDVNNFLHSKAKKKSWKLTQKVEDHITWQFDKVDLPVDLSTTGDKPLTFTVTKHEGLHEDIQKRKALMKSYLNQLQ